MGLALLLGLFQLFAPLVRLLQHDQRAFAGLATQFLGVLHLVHEGLHIGALEELLQLLHLLAQALVLGAELGQFEGRRLGNDVLLKGVGDTARPFGVAEGVDGFFQVKLAGRHAADEGGRAVATQGVLKETSEFGIAVGHVGRLLAQGIHDLSQGEEVSVDVNRLSQTRAYYLGLLDALRSGQVHQGELGRHRWIDRGIGDGKRGDHVRATGTLVEPRRSGSTALLCLDQEGQYL